MIYCLLKLALSIIVSERKLILMSLQLLSFCSFLKLAKSVDINLNPWRVDPDNIFLIKIIFVYQYHTIVFLFFFFEILGPIWGNMPFINGTIYAAPVNIFAQTSYPTTILLFLFFLLRDNRQRLFLPYFPNFAYVAFIFLLVLSGSGWKYIFYFFWRRATNINSELPRILRSTTPHTRWKPN